jgi:beta-galactosidase
VTVTHSRLSRRNFLQCALSLAALHSTRVRALTHLSGNGSPASTSRSIPLNLDWQFAKGADPTPDAWSRVDLPHCVNKLSWQDWDFTQWQTLWTYRKEFTASPAAQRARCFLRFDAVMTKASPMLNGSKLEEHMGGFLPFEREVTHLLRDRNLLTVGVDAQWLNVPPGGSPKGTTAVDYLMPGGITRGVSLLVRPPIFLSDVFAKPVNCLESARSVIIECTIDTQFTAARNLTVHAELLDGTTLLAHEHASCSIAADGLHATSLTLSRLGNIQLWSPENPKLYSVRVTLHDERTVLDMRTVRIGFREARFDVDGFFLNGVKSRIFGLNRHEIYPFVGFAMPERVMRRDAEILRHDFNCNTVRCSHYPQTEAFLDACDELGLMVWEEIPGWGYIGDDAWKALALRDTEAMIRRDRNHPSIIIWGTRVNESHNDLELYQKTNAISRKLDGTRPVSGSMTSLSTKNWLQGVYAYDDYHAREDGSVDMAPPLPGVPFMFSEAVGQFQYCHGGNGFHQYYRRAGDRSIFEQQALYHAQGHDRGNSDPRCAGVIAWCAFDYASPLNSTRGIKWPGVSDVFRIPKFGAAFYRSQVSPSKRPIIEPSFYWDVDDAVRINPGESAWIYSNCDALVVTVGAKAPMHVLPQHAAFPNLAYPPFYVDLSSADEGHFELRIDGYVANQLVLSRNFSSERSRDTLFAQADDEAIDADGMDATRVVFRAVDRYGAPAPCVDGVVNVHCTGPAALVGDMSFNMSETGGVGAVWVRSRAGQPGTVKITFDHPRLAEKSVTVRTRSQRA